MEKSYRSSLGEMNTEDPGVVCFFCLFVCSFVVIKLKYVTNSMLTATLHLPNTYLTPT